MTHDDIVVGNFHCGCDDMSPRDGWDISLSDLSPEAQALLRAALALRDGCSDPPCIPDWGDCDRHEALAAAAGVFAARPRGAKP